mgnify:FL=1
MKKLSFFLFFLIFFQSGCFLAPVAEMAISPITTGVIAWNNSYASKYYNQEIIIIHRSLRNSLKKLNHTVISDIRKKDGSYYIVAGSKDRFRIEIKNAQENITEVVIHVNLFGDKPYAELIYKEIDANLDVIDFDNQGSPEIYQN